MIRSSSVAAFANAGSPRDVWHATDEFYVLGNLAVGIGSVRFTVEQSGGVPVQAIHRYMLMWRREPDGTWRIFRNMMNNAMPSVAAPTTS